MSFKNPIKFNKAEMAVLSPLGFTVAKDAGLLGMSVPASNRNQARHKDGIIMKKYRGEYRLYIPVPIGNGMITHETVFAEDFEGIVAQFLKTR